jgi:tetratricopeptide (TPR) repeat protein
MRIFGANIFLLLIGLFPPMVFAQNPVLDSLKKILVKTASDTQRVNILLVMVENEWDNKIWPDYNRQAMTIIEKNTASESERTKKTLARQKAACLINMAYLHQLKNQNDSALLIYDKAYGIARKLQDEKLLASINNNTGSIYYQMGDQLRALKNYSEALAIMEKTNDKASIASTLNNIGLIHGAQKEKRKAISFYSKALKIHMELNNPIEVAKTYNNISLQYIRLNLLDSAMAHYKMAFDVLNGQDKQLEAVILSGIAEIFNRIRDHKNWYLYLVRSFQIKKELNVPSFLAPGYNSMGNYHAVMYKTTRNKKYLDTAKVELEKAYELARKYRIMETELTASYNLSLLYNDLGKFEDAYRFLVINQDLFQQTYNDETQKASIQQAMKYEYEKKEAVLQAERAKDKLLAEQEKKRQNTMLMFVLLILFLTITLAAFIFRSLQQNKKKNRIIEEQKELVEEKQKEILDSIHYAKRIQNALITSEKYIEKKLKQN